MAGIHKMDAERKKTMTPDQTTALDMARDFIDSACLVRGAFFNAAIQGDVEGVNKVLALFRDEETAELLKAVGADINAGGGEDGMTALMLAAKNGKFSVVKALLAIPGIDVNVRNKSGKTAWMLANENGRVAEAVHLEAAPGFDMKLNRSAEENAILALAERSDSKLSNALAALEAAGFSRAP